MANTSDSLTDALADALRHHLPADQHGAIPMLAQILADAARGAAHPDDTSSPELAKALAALAGKQVDAGRALIDFGEESQIGDVTISGDVVGGDVVKLALHIPDTPPPDVRPPSWWERFRHHPLIFFPTVIVGVLIAILTLIVGGIDAINGFPQAQRQLDAWGVTNSIQPEQPGETLLIVAPFYHSDGVMDTEPHIKIRRAIEQAAKEAGLATLRVETAPQALRADDRAGAEDLAKRYGASIMVWGEDTGVEVIVSFLNHRQPTFDAADVTVTEQERTQLVNPSAYARFITSDLPGEMTFLALFAIGQSYYVTNQFDAARRVISQATQTVSSNSTIDGLADAFFRLGWLHQQVEGELSAALIAYTKAIHLNATYTKAYINRGTVYHFQGQYMQAIQDYTKATLLDPTDALIFTNRGFTHFIQKKYVQAIEDYTKAIQLEPTFAIAFVVRGMAYDEHGDIPQAIADFTEAARLDPTNAGIFYNRGLAYAHQGAYSQTIIDLTEAIRLDPAFSDAFINRGNAYSAQGEYSQALADYTEAIHLNPTDDLAFTNRGLTYRDQGVYPQAIADFTEAIRLNPANILALTNRGFAYLRQDGYTQAITDFTEVIRLDSTNTLAFTNRGAAYLHQGAYLSAIADFTEAIRLAPTYAAAFYNRGLAYADQGRNNLAIADLTRARDLATDPALREAAIQKLQELEEP